MMFKVVVVVVFAATGVAVFALLGFTFVVFNKAKPK